MDLANSDTIRYRGSGYEYETNMMQE